MPRTFRRRPARVLATALLLAGSVPHLFGYAFESHSWPLGSNVPVRLGLGPASSGFLQDGFSSFDASAADALNAWKQYTNLISLTWSTVPGASGDNDGINEAFFASTVYGQAFGSGVLAVTLSRTNGAITLEADNIFNSALLWDSYRGALQYNSKKRQYTFDFHRVALHEFGHTLGLAHPDDYGQTVTAIMNSHVSDLDHLAPDDIVGMKWLYGIRITSPLAPPPVEAGDHFTYQITANNSPTSYAASNLPPGLQLNGATGAISGVPSQAGSYNTNISATGNRGTASAVLTIRVNSPQITSEQFSSVNQGYQFDYQITVSKPAAGFSVSNLPGEFELDSATGRITGIAANSGSFDITLIAHTAYGDAVMLLRLTVIAPQITSPARTTVMVGSSFSYQITDSNEATSFDATQMPAGLTMDHALGIISGIPTLSGTYVIRVTAHGQYSDAVGFIQIVVQPGNVNLDPVIATIDISPYGGPYAMASDPIRSRIYVACDNGLLVINSATYSVQKLVPVSNGLRHMTISADASVLWFDSWNSGIGRIDLNTLTQVANLPFNDEINSIKEGLSNRLYVGNFNGVHQIDATTGQAQTVFRTSNTYPNGGEVIEMSKDRKSLFAGDNTFAPSFISKYDISTPTPVEVQRSPTVYGWARQFAISHDGKFLCLTSWQDAVIPTSELSPANLSVNYGSFNWAVSPLTAIFSHNDTLFFETGVNDYDVQPQGGQIAIFNAATHSLLRTILYPNGWNGGPVTTDLSDEHLFAVQFQLYTPVVLVYQLVPHPPPALPKTLTNVSTRTVVGTADNMEIGGFIIQGSEPKKVLLRALAPSLSELGVSGAMADPVLELHDASGAVIASNDNWNATRQEVIATGYAPANEHECSIVTTLPPSTYTAVVRGVNRTSGTALFELYDFDPTKSEIANISTRGNVGVGDNVMIGGFIVGGDQPTNVLVRAVGPTLTNFGVTGALADPTLELRNGNGVLVAQNDNWKSDQEAAIRDSGYAPPDDAEAAILATMQPGSYTAIVRGANNTSGVALVEIYNLDAK